MVNPIKKIEQILKQFFFKKIKNCKVVYKGSVIHKLIHCNAKYKLLNTSFIAQNTLFNLTKNKTKTQHFFSLVTLFKNNQTELIRNLKA